MQITVRTLLASVTVTAVLGGAIGALATATTTSQASPEAIAAAVQKVSDQKAQTWLHILDIDLEGVKRNQEQLQATTESIENNAYASCYYTTKGIAAYGCKP